MSNPVAPYRSPPPLLVVISGPSAVGKDALLMKLRELNLPLHFAVTATTRPRRDDEVEGQHYYFLSDAEYDRLLQEGEFLEHATVYGTYRYGVPRTPIRAALAEGRDVILRVDPIQGATTLRRIVPDAVFIFLAPPSVSELERRLRQRAGEVNFEERRRVALEELARIKDFEYVVINERDRLDEAVEKIRAIMTAEKCRVGRRPVVI